MPEAARLFELTSHPGIVTGPGAARVLINGLPAARVTDAHACLIAPVPHAPSVIEKGSATVLIEGQPAARKGDSAACGSVITGGSVNVLIGG